MSLRNRLSYLQYLCESLQDTDSLVIKRQIVNEIPVEYKDDFNFILEILAGKHKLGYTYNKTETIDIMPAEYAEYTIRQYLQPLWRPILTGDLSHNSINAAQYCCRWETELIASIVNRTLRLGIGNSLLDKSELAPMLAKKYEGNNISDTEGIYVTEKLDGNRCIASYDGIKWNFTSRNGKPMYVDFDMSNLPTEFVYDGEVLSIEQTNKSKQLANAIITGHKDVLNTTSTVDFQSTSGMINRHSKDKKLVYNIFDIIVDRVNYKTRRVILDTLTSTDDVRILPLLARYEYHTSDTHSKLCDLLDDVTSSGAEGLMINSGSGFYEHKRCNDLLKFKKFQTMDMRVIDWEYGTGKYEYCVGYLICEAFLDNGKIVHCKVGTGLTDEQRQQWTQAGTIIGKIVEVAYFSVSQSMSATGTKTYSLRFPRLKSVRNDKIETSQY